MRDSRDTIATGKPYQDVYDALNSLAVSERTGKRKRGVSSSRTGVYRTTYDKYLRSLGWTWTPTMQIGQGCKVHLRGEELPKGRLIVAVSKHLTAVIDGVIHDTQNPARDGTRCVYGYYAEPCLIEPLTAKNEYPANSVTCSFKLQAPFTLADMERFAVEAWGKLGASVVKKWAEFNHDYFAGELRPIPLIITPTLPYGKRIADCLSGEHLSGRRIRLNVPVGGRFLVADNNTLLHEMIHQYLFERREDASHQSEGWRSEIMRLTKLITGAEIWAGRYKTKRTGKNVFRINEPHPDGRQSLQQKQIARWPHDGIGIDLGKLGK